MNTLSVRQVAEPIALNEPEHRTKLLYIGNPEQGADLKRKEGNSNT